MSARNKLNEWYKIDKWIYWDVNIDTFKFERSQLHERIISRSKAKMFFEMFLRSIISVLPHFFPPPLDPAAAAASAFLACFCLMMSASLDNTSSVLLLLILSFTWCDSPLHPSLLGHPCVSGLVTGSLVLPLVLLGGLLPGEVPLVAPGHGEVSQ